MKYIMKQTIHISIFGLSLSLINTLKSSISNLLEDGYNLAWTNLSDQRLQILLINADFIHSPQIKKIIEKNIKILQIDKDEYNASKILDNILYLPLNDLNPLNNWLINNIKNSADEIQLPKPNHLSKINYQTAELLINNLYQDTINRKYLLKYANSQIALIDLDQQLFYLNTQLNIEEIGQFYLVKADLDTLVKFRELYKASNLKQALWNFFWKHLEQTDSIYPNYYQLKQWPHVLDFDQRRDLFKLSALFSKGSNISFAEQELKLGQKYITQFICISNLVGMLDEINIQEAHFKNSASIETHPTNNIMKSFFHKLRKKLGI